MTERRGPAPPLASEAPRPASKGGLQRGKASATAEPGEGPGTSSEAAQAEGLETERRTREPTGADWEFQPPRGSDEKGAQKCAVAGRTAEPGSRGPSGRAAAARGSGPGERRGSTDRGAGGSDPGGGVHRGGEKSDRSSRPVRVFVSQGDMVYIDEVEAMALRGRPGEENAVEGGQGERDGDEEQGGAPPQRPKEAGMAAKDVSEASGLEGGGAEGTKLPAFFDPLLNPGNRGNADQEKKPWASAVVLMVPLRLGLDELSPGYIPGACPRRDLLERRRGARTVCRGCLKMGGRSASPSCLRAGYS